MVSFSIQRKSGLVLTDNNSIEIRTCKNDRWCHDIVNVLSRYHDVLVDCVDRKESSGLIVYLMELARKVTSSIHMLRVKGQSAELACERMYLFNQAQRVLRHVFYLMCIQPVDRMWFRLEVQLRQCYYMQQRLGYFWHRSYDHTSINFQHKLNYSKIPYSRSRPD